MKISYDDYEAVTEIANLASRMLEVIGVTRDPIDITAGIYDWMNSTKGHEDEFGYYSTELITMIYVPGDPDDLEMEPGAYEILISLGEINDDGCHHIFDGIGEIEFMDSVPEEDRNLGEI